MKHTFLFKFQLIVFFILLLNSNVESLAQDSLNAEELILVDTTLSPEERVASYLELYLKHVNTNIEKATYYNEEALKISLEHNFEQNIISSYYFAGDIARFQARNDEAIDYYKICIGLLEHLNNTRALSAVNNNIGIAYKNKGELKLSLEYYSKALKLAEEIGFTIGIVDAISNIALVYTLQEDYERALVYFEKSLELQKEDEDQLIIFNNIGTVYKDLGDYPKALDYFQRSLEISLKIGDGKSQTHPLSNIGELYVLLEKYEMALEKFFEVMEVEERLNLRADLLLTYEGIGLVYRKLKDYDEAIVYLNKAKIIAIEISSDNMLSKIYLSYALMYEEKGDYKESSVNLKKHIEIVKRVYNVERNKQVEEMLARFETESKEKEIILLKKEKELKTVELKTQLANLEKQELYRELEKKKNENRILLLEKQNEFHLLTLEKQEIETDKKKKEIVYLTKEAELKEIKFEKKQAELRQKNTLKNSAIVVAGLIILSSIILIIIYQQKIKTVELLNIRTEEVNKQKIYELIRDQEFMSMQSNVEGQEKERLRISRELHDGIGGNLASIKLNLANILKNNKDKELLKVLGYIDDTYNEVRSISHNLVPTKIMNEAFTTFIQNFINEILDRKLLNVKCTFFPENELNFIPSEIKIELYRVIQELMNNITKYSNAKNVEIQLIKRDDQVNLMVEDDGVGFDTKHSNSGIGLVNIQTRIHKLNGEVSIESVIGEWTLINIEIPLIKS